METPKEPLFILTAEEVRIVTYMIKKSTLDEFESCEDLITASDLLDRIKQWQDERNS